MKLKHLLSFIIIGILVFSMFKMIGEESYKREQLLIEQNVKLIQTAKKHNPHGAFTYVFKDGFESPTPNEFLAKITCEFQTDKVSYTHSGIDITCKDRRVIPSRFGMVSEIGYNKQFGNYIFIFHPDKAKFTFYAHLKEVNVDESQFVTRKDIIGIIGNTGKVRVWDKKYGYWRWARSNEDKGKHLHFEIHELKSDKKKMVAINPVENSTYDELVKQGIHYSFMGGGTLW